MVTRSLALALVMVSLCALDGHARAGSGPGQGRPWIGIVLAEGTRGVKVREVVAAAPGGRAGLRAGDEILAIDGVAVRRPEALITCVQRKTVGESVALAVLRGRRELRVTLVLAARPDELALVKERLLGKPAPSFPIVDVLASGRPAASLASLSGQVVVVEFWATWCGACRRSLPRLDAWARKYRDRGLRVLAVSSEDPNVLRRFADGQELAFTIASDQDERTSDLYLIPALPTMVMIDRGGVVRRVEVGVAEGGGEALEASLEELLSLPPPDARAGTGRP